MRYKLLAPIIGLVLMAVAVIAIPGGTSVLASHLTGNPATYTLDLDFDDGTLINVNHDAPGSDQLQLDSQATPFQFIWVAVSSKGTAVKIDTLTGVVLGEYRTAPLGMKLNPSRTTVDGNGNVWVTNRNENGWVAANAIAPGLPPVNRYMGSVVRVGLEQNGQCQDRNGNGVIDTSTGLNDIRGWTNAGGVDALGGVSTAADECIINYVRVNSTGARHVSVTATNDVWVSGTGGRFFDLVDGATGAIVRQENPVPFGGYGGLIDGSGVIWSARDLLRWDTANPLTGPNGDPSGSSVGPPAAGTNWSGQYDFDSYGLCIDSHGNVWNTDLSGNRIHKYAPDGTHLGSFPHGAGSGRAQGCVVDGNDHVWTAHALDYNRNTVGHLLNDGTFVGNVVLSDANVGPTGVAVDAAGKIWATGHNSQRAYRIDPSLGAIGGGGVPIGGQDLRTVPLGGSLYNYSDMTGSTLVAPPNTGAWTIDHDTGFVDAEWGTVSWTAGEPGDSSITVTAASSTDGITFGPPKAVTNGVDLSGANGQFLRVTASFTRSSTDGDRDGINDSPILFDLTIAAITNQPPDCSDAFPSIAEIWPPNHKWVDVNILGVTDPDGDPVTITIDSIVQDEPVDTYGDGNFTPDGQGVGTDTASVRAERSGTKKVPGDGRFYHIGFTADDGQGATCSLDGGVQVVVPHDQGKKSAPPVDSGPPYYDSTALSP